jgi:hypothetical protein
MPRLRKYAYGSGYYLTDYLQGVGYCTWQIGREGLGYLRDRGVEMSGDHVSGRDRNELRDRGWIWVTGAHPDRLPPGVAVLPADLRPLAEELSRWAARGSLDELQRILHGTHSDHRDCCFSPSFLKWLAALDAGLGLAGLDVISAPDFEDSAAPVLDALREPLHSFFARRGETHVLWQLARVVALVARQQRGSPTCPALWRERYPVLHRLFVQIGELAFPARPARQSVRLGRPNRLGLVSPPCVVWEVDLQQVVALLRPQTLPSGVRGMTWRMDSVEAVPQPQTWTEADGVRVEETRSRPLSPARSYLIETELHGQSPPFSERHRIELPDGFVPCILFAADGTMLGVADESALPPGDYLALVKREIAGRLFQRRGVRQVERIDIAPVGWHGWQGWRLCLDPGAEVAPYIVEADSSPATWDVEPPPETVVRWRETLGVYVGCWPRLFVTSPEAFTSAIIEVGREPAAQADHLLAVGAPGGVPLQGEGERHFLDFEAVASLERYYGTVRLICRPPAQPDAPPLTARFIRLPQMTLAYVPDPVRPEQALAVHVQGNADLLDGLIGDSDTELLRGPEGIVLRAKAPHVSPGVCAKLSGNEAAVRVRVPATRLGLVTEGSGFLGWQEPPLSDLDLSTIETGDRLRIELHEEPALEDSRLLCRLVGGDEIAAGWLIGSGGPVWQFEVELHRWRDGFGLTSAGTIQARTHRRWADIVLLREREEPTRPVSPPEPVSERTRLVLALEEALARDDRAEIRQVATECQAHITDTMATPVDRELLLLAVARASAVAAAGKNDLREAERCLAELGDRPDLPEVEIIRRIVGLRHSNRPGSGCRMSVDEVERLSHGLPNLPQAILFRAECWYRFCRQARESASGAWQTCLDLSGRFLARTTGRPWERGAALLLRAIARLMLALEPDSPPTATSSAAPTDAWLAALRLAAQSVRTPRYRVAPRAVPKLPDEDISILSPEDAALVRIIVAHAAGCPADEAHFADLSSWGREQFFAISLLRARQARLKGNELEAREAYNRVLREAMNGGPDFLLDVEAGERGRWASDAASVS